MQAWAGGVITLVRSKGTCEKGADTAKYLFIKESVE